MAEISLGAGHGSLPKQVWNNRIHQGSQGHLKLSHQGSQSHLCHPIQEAKTFCSMAIRDTEVWGASQAGALQQSYGKSLQHLEEQAIEEENRSQLDFLSTCQTTLWAIPVELHGMLVVSYQVQMGQVPMFLPLSLLQGVSSSEQVPIPVALSSPAPKPLPRPKQWHPSPDLVDVLAPSRTTSQANLAGPPSSKQQEVMPLYKALTPSHLEAFNQDSSLVREMREEYFKRHCPHFSTENTHYLSEVFRCMIVAAELLGFSIYKIKETWTWPDELQQANYALRTLPKGLKFLRAVSQLESLKVMGLMGIHDLDTLCHFYGVTHCPWCGKEGQNEGIIVNHLMTVHYRLGLVCKKCHSYLYTSSEAICCYGQKECQPSGEGGAHESSSLA